MKGRREALLSALEERAALFSLYGYKDLAEAAAAVCEALYRGETVWAVVLADAKGFGRHFVEELRLAYGVGRIE